MISRMLQTIRFQRKDDDPPPESATDSPPAAAPESSRFSRPMVTVSVESLERIADRFLSLDSVTPTYGERITVGWLIRDMLARLPAEAEQIVFQMHE